MTSKKYRCPECGLKGNRTNKVMTYLGILPFYDKEGRKHEHDASNRITERFECGVGHTWSHSRIGSNCWCGWRPEDSEHYKECRASEAHFKKLEEELTARIPGVKSISYCAGQIRSYEVDGKHVLNPDYVEPPKQDLGLVYGNYIPVYGMSNRQRKKRGLKKEKTLAQIIAEMPAEHRAKFKYKTGKVNPAFYSKVNIANL